MPITRRVIEAYLNCKYKAHLLSNGRIGTPHDLETVLAELQAGYREKAAAILVRKGCKAVRPSASSDIRSGDPVIRIDY
jgi:hypothetical protein